MKILAFGISHHPALAYYDTDSRILQYIELEKYTKIKCYTPNLDYDIEYLKYIKNLVKLYSISDLDVIIVDNDGYPVINDNTLYTRWFRHKKITKDVIFQCNHNLNHVLPCILNNNTECLALDIEGMGDERISTILYTFKNNKIEPIYQIKHFSYGFVYQLIGSLILSTILNKNISIYDSSIPGKFMAVCGISKNYIESIGNNLYNMFHKAIEDDMWHSRYSENKKKTDIYIYISVFIKI